MPPPPAGRPFPAHAGAPALWNAGEAVPSRLLRSDCLAALAIDASAPDGGILGMPRPALGGGGGDRGAVVEKTCRHRHHKPRACARAYRPAGALREWPRRPSGPRAAPAPRGWRDAAPRCGACLEQAGRAQPGAARLGQGAIGCRRPRVCAGPALPGAPGAGASREPARPSSPRSDGQARGPGRGNGSRRLPWQATNFHLPRKSPPPLSKN